MRTYDARAWLVWLIVGGLLAISISNPLYLILLLISSRLVEIACTPLESKPWRLPLFRMSLLILLFSTIFNMLTAHVGETVLFKVPQNWPLIGGPVTAEAAVYGFLSGLRLVTLLSFFLTFNSIVPVSQLIGLAPRAIHELGLVMVIAITYVPETIRQFQRIRDAQAIRGHQFGGLGAWRPVIIPLLISGLERALNLSETMVSRGYGSTTYVRMPIRARMLLLSGLALILAGAIRVAWAGYGGWLLLGTGTGAIGMAYYYLSRLISRTTYRARQWAFSDTLVVIGSMIALIPLLPIGVFDHWRVDYSPYPSFTPPLFSLVIGISLLGLVSPVLITTFGMRKMEIGL